MTVAMGGASFPGQHTGADADANTQTLASVGNPHDDIPSGDHAGAQQGSEARHACADVVKYEGWWELVISKNPNTADGVVAKDENGTVLLFTYVRDSGNEFRVQHFNGKNIQRAKWVETVMDQTAKIIEGDKLAMTWKQYYDPDVIFTRFDDGKKMCLKEETDQRGGAKKKQRESTWVYRGKAENLDGGALRKYYELFKPSVNFDAANNAARSTPPVWAGGLDGGGQGQSFQEDFPCAAWGLEELVSLKVGVKQEA